jgi:serine/threonine protein kinase
MVSISDKRIDNVQLYRSESKPSATPQPQQQHPSPQVVAVLSMKNVTKESILGVGGFNTVFRVRVNVNQQIDIDIDGGFTSQDRLYALKCLNMSSSSCSSEKHVRQGGRDLAIEAHLLSRLDHKHIIKVHAISDAISSGLDATSASCHEHFLLLEALEEKTLERQLEFLVTCKAPSRPSPYHDKGAAMDRVRNIATGIAKGLQHLHENNIVLRDLKPSNVGFDKSGCLKLFDLGLAREIHNIGERDIAGTLSYLAPEIFMGQTASLKSDIYSFGILLWELITLKRAFKKFSGCQKQFKENVLVGSWRPPVSSIPSKALRQLITDCWDPDPEKRPDITQVLEVLNSMESPCLNSPHQKKKSPSLKKRNNRLKTWLSPLFPFFGKNRSNIGGLVSTTSQYSLEDSDIVI